MITYRRGPTHHHQHRTETCEDRWGRRQPSARAGRHNTALTSGCGTRTCPPGPGQRSRTGTSGPPRSGTGSRMHHRLPSWCPSGRNRASAKNTNEKRLGYGSGKKLTIVVDFNWSASVRELTTLIWKLSPCKRELVHDKIGRPKDCIPCYR